eukprot:scaffold908_cov228-Pinguiococcus_pyrenoidosus.AAC.12
MSADRWRQRQPFRRQAPHVAFGTPCAPLFALGRRFLPLHRTIVAAALRQLPRLSRSSPWVQLPPHDGLVRCREAEGGRPGSRLALPGAVLELDAPSGRGHDQVGPARMGGRAR